MLLILNTELSPKLRHHNELVSFVYGRIQTISCKSDIKEFIVGRHLVIFNLEKPQ